MRFLDPGAGLIACAASVPILIALYLLKLRRKPVRVSSTLLWDSIVQDLQANVPLRWLRPSWLLALQMLALLALVAAIARPAVPAQSSVAPRTILLLDTTASMSAMDAPGGTPEKPRSRFSEAQDRALELVEQIGRAAGPRAVVSVIALGSEARVLVDSATDLRDVRDAIRDLKPTDQPGNLKSALKLVQAAAGSSSDESDPSRTSLLIVSDGAILTPQSSDISLPGTVDLKLVRVGPASASVPDNLGIVALAARRDADNPSLIRVFARVANTNAQEINTVLSCKLNDEAAQIRSINLPARPQEASAGLSEVAVSFEIESASGGIIVGRLPRSDILSSDNAAAIIVRPLSRASITVVGPGSAPDPYAALRGIHGIDRFLLGALQDIDAGTIRTMDARSYESEAGSSRDASSSPGATPESDLIIFDRVVPRRLPNVPTMHFGAQPPGIPGLSVRPLTESEAERSATRFIAWSRNHPVLRHAPLDAVLISPPMRMDIVQREIGDTAAADPTITPLAFGAGGALIAQVQYPGMAGIRRLVLAMDLVRTNWGPDVSFPVFVASAVEFLTGRGEAAQGLSYTLRDAVQIRAAAGATRVRVTGPESFDVELPAVMTDSTDPAPSIARPAPVVSIGTPQLAGIYSLSGVVARDETIAVNLVDSFETACSVADAVNVGGRVATIQRSDTAAELPWREVWHWFVLAAVALLSLEWVLFAWKMKQ